MKLSLSPTAFFGWHYKFIRTSFIPPLQHEILFQGASAVVQHSWSLFEGLAVLKTATKNILLPLKAEASRVWSYCEGVVARYSSPAFIYFRAISLPWLLSRLHSSNNMNFATIIRLAYSSLPVPTICNWWIPRGNFFVLARSPVRDFAIGAGEVEWLANL